MKKLNVSAMLLTSVLATLALTTVTPAQAGIGSSLMQTANVRKPGEYEIKAQGDIVFNNGGGFNIGPHFGAGIVEHYLDAEFLLGTGTTDFFVGTIAKYNLLPDMEGQAGLALNFGAMYLTDRPKGTDNNINSLLLTFGVLLSKDFNTDWGVVSPYTSFQFEGLINTNKNVVPLTLLIGSKWKVAQASPWNFYSEFSIDLNKSLWGLALGAGYPFN